MAGLVSNHDPQNPEINHDFDNPDWVPLVETPFRVWLQESHPDDLPLLYESVDTWTPLVTTESLVLWETRVTEFLATL